MLKRLSQYLCILLIFVLANIFLSYQIGNLGYLSINLLLIFVFARYISTGYFIFLFALSQFISSFYSSIDIVGCVAVLITIIVGLIYAIFQKSFKNKYIYLVDYKYRIVERFEINHCPMCGRKLNDNKEH